MIKTINVQGKSHKIDYNSLENLPSIPADQSEKIAELETALANQRALTVSLAKASGCEDKMSLELYPDYPHITFAISEDVLSSKILKGNSDTAEELQTFGRNVVIAYNKDGYGFDKGDEIDEKGELASTAQFNALIEVPEGKVGVIVASPEEAFNKPMVTKTSAEGNFYKIQLTKVTADVAVNIFTKTPFRVTYTNNTAFNLEDNNKGAAPTTATEDADLIFKVVHNSNSTGHDDIPVKAIINEVEFDIPCTEKGKNKDQFTLSKDKIDGDINITIGLVASEKTDGDSSEQA